MVAKRQEAVREYLAAGGIVLHPDGGRILVLIRPSRDEVRLPKGHVELHEAPETAAQREVAEESGYDDLIILQPLGEQLVAFTDAQGKPVQRIELYYLMQARSLHEYTRPLEDVLQFYSIWLTWDEALEHLTYEAEREWVRRARKAYGA